MMAKPRLNTRQKAWLQSFLAKYPYYKLCKTKEGLSQDRILFLEGCETLPLPLIREFEGANPGFRMHTLEVKLRVYGDPRLTPLHDVTTIYPHCNIGDKLPTSEREGQLSLSISTVLEIPPPINPVIVTWKPKGKAKPKLGNQLNLPVTGLEAKLFALRQQARPHLPPISAQELAQEKVATWSAREKREVELPQVVVDLLLAQNATEDEWQSAMDLFPYIGMAATLNFIDGLPVLRQHFNKPVSTVAVSTAVPVVATTNVTNVNVANFVSVHL